MGLASKKSKSEESWKEEKICLREKEKVLGKVARI